MTRAMNGSFIRCDNREIGYDKKGAGMIKGNKGTPKRLSL